MGIERAKSWYIKNLSFQLKFVHQCLIYTPILGLQFKKKIYSFLIPFKKIVIALNSSKWVFDWWDAYFEKISDSDWIEMENGRLIAKYSEISNLFDKRNDNKPEVILKNPLKYVKLVEGNSWRGSTLGSITNFIASGMWQHKTSNQS